MFTVLLLPGFNLSYLLFNQVNLLIQSIQPGNLSVCIGVLGSTTQGAGLAVMQQVALGFQAFETGLQCPLVQ